VLCTLPHLWNGLIHIYIYTYINMLHTAERPLLCSTSLQGSIDGILKWEAIRVVDLSRTQVTGELQKSCRTPIHWHFFGGGPVSAQFIHHAILGLIHYDFDSPLVGSQLVDIWLSSALISTGMHPHFLRESKYRSNYVDNVILL